MNQLTNAIVTNRDILTRKLQEETSSILDLHLPDCVINNNLSPQQLYNELSLHAYAYHRAIRPLAKTIMRLLYQRSLPNGPDVADDILEKTYIPVAKKLIKRNFIEQFGNHLNNSFYNQLPYLADYTGAKYLSNYLPIEKLPKLRKPRVNKWVSIWGLNKKVVSEFEFILNTSEFTKYINGKRQKREKGYGQFCEWCNEEFDLLSARTIKTELDHIFVCSKRCSDAARNSWKRHHYLKPKSS